MRNLEAVLALATSPIALLFSQAAAAQNAPAAAPAAAAAPQAPAEGADIVITGTRGRGRSRLDASLAAIVPSIDFPRSAAVDGTAVESFSAASPQD